MKEFILQSENYITGNSYIIYADNEFEARKMLENELNQVISNDIWDNVIVVDWMHPSMVEKKIIKL